MIGGSSGGTELQLLSRGVARVRAGDRARDPLIVKADDAVIRELSLDHAVIVKLAEIAHDELAVH